MINFIIGLIIGVPVGIFLVFVYCLCAIASDVDRRMDKAIAEMVNKAEDL